MTEAEAAELSTRRAMVMGSSAASATSTSRATPSSRTTKSRALSPVTGAPA